MKLRNVLLSVFALSFSTLSVATPVVLDFEANHYEGTYNGGKVYSGFVVKGGSIVTEMGNNYYKAVTGSGQPYEAVITITRKDGALFNFEGGGLGTYASQGDYAYVGVIGSLKGVTKASTGYGAYSYGGTELKTPTFLGIDTLTFYAYQGSALLTHFTIDNLRFDINPINPVPEPSTYAMMIAGLGMVGVMIKRRRASSQV